MEKERKLILTKCIEDIRAYHTISKFDEAETKQKIVSRILDSLGWNMFSDEVKPEYSVGELRVDFSLRIKGENRVFIEVKSPQKSLENKQYQEQLLVYSFHKGVSSGILTNGVLWWFYLPLQQGDWNDRRYCTVDVMADEVDEIVRSFGDFLSKHSIEAGKALRIAESLLVGIKKTKRIKQSLPEAWNRIVTDQNTFLIDLLEETAVRVCDFDPTESELSVIHKEVRQFISDNQTKWLLPTLVNTTSTPSHKKPKGAINTNEQTKIQVETGNKKLLQIHFFGKLYTLNRSKDLLVLVANWLVDQGHLNPAECPLSVTKSKTRYLVSHTPKHPKGNGFFNAEKLSNGLYIETHASTETIIKHSLKLLNRYKYPEDSLEILTQ